MNPGARDNKPAQFPTLPMGHSATLGAEIALRFGWPEVYPEQRGGLWREFNTPMGRLTDIAVANHFVKLAHAFNTEDIEQIRAVLHGDYGSMAAPEPLKIAPPSRPPLKEYQEQLLRELAKRDRGGSYGT